jgi:hypothetical protein
MVDNAGSASHKKPGFAYLAEFGSSLLGIGVGIVVATQFPAIVPYGWWIVGVGALLAIIGWLARIWLTEKVS